LQKEREGSNSTKISAYNFLNGHVILTTPLFEMIVSWDSYIKSTVSHAWNSGGTLQVYENHSCKTTYKITLHHL